MKKIIIKLNEKTKFLLVLLCIIVVWTVRLFPFKFGGWNQIMLAFSYRYGFIQRAFIGSCIDVISTAFHIPLKYMRYIYGIVTMLIFTSVMLLYAYKSQSKNGMDSQVKIFLQGLMLLFLLGPGWNTNYNNFALTDVWLLIVSITGMRAVMHEKNIWLAIVAAIMGELIHPAYVFLYFNLILVVFCYRVWIDDKRNNHKIFAYLIITFIVDAILFIYMMFIAKAKPGVNLEEIMNRAAAITNKTVPEISNHAITVKGYLLREDNVNGIQFVINSYWLLFVVMILVFSPFIYELFKYWRNIVKNAKLDSKIKATTYALMPFGIITTIPMYIMHNDYGRWTYAAFFYEFAIIWMLNYVEDKNVVASTHVFMKCLRQHTLYYFFLMFYATMMGPFEQNLINPIISLIETIGWKILGVY